MKMKKVLVACLSLIMATTMLTSCGNSNSADSSSKKAEETMKAEEVGVNADKYKESSVVDEDESSKADDKKEESKTDNSSEESTVENGGGDADVNAETPTEEEFPYANELSQEDQQIVKDDKRLYYNKKYTKVDDSINLSKFKVTYNGRSNVFDLQKLKANDFFNKTGLYMAESNCINFNALTEKDSKNKDLPNQMKDYTISEKEAQDLSDEFASTNDDGYPFYRESTADVVDDKNTLINYKTSGFGIDTSLLKYNNAKSLVVTGIELADTNKSHFDNDFLNNSEFDFDEYGMTSPTVDVELCEGIKLGTSRQEVEKKLGKFNPNNSKSIFENAAGLATATRNRSITYQDVALYYNSKGLMIIYYYKDKVCDVKLENNFILFRVDKLHN